VAESRLWLPIDHRPASPPLRQRRAPITASATTGWSTSQKRALSVDSSPFSSLSPTMQLLGSPAMKAGRRYGAVGLVLARLVAARLGAADRDQRLVNAAQRQDWQTVRTLVTAKVDVNAPQGDGATALHWAAHADNLQMVDLLLRAGADANAANAHGVTPLWLACENASVAVVERLVQAGANPNATLPVQRETVLMTAALSGNVAIVKTLLDHSANVNAATAISGQSALMWAVSQGHDDVARLLIERGADVRAR